ncbi:uncharacterized protein LOC143608061 [Bidens hawaiensis]|uniref:uncharacterized protein LOC143608061 n=1 Tax=Bidens hawaiensis TaxID=980011 RepID=UPI00404940A1
MTYKKYTRCINKDTVFQGCLVASIARIGNGKHVLLLGKVNIIGGDHDGLTVILEAAASFDLWIWHAFFGTLGANNDVAVINASPIFDRLTNGVSPDISFSANDVNYEYRYYLVDGIYPEWAMLVLSFTCPTDEKHHYFKKKNESARKDIERAFGLG